MSVIPEPAQRLAPQARWAWRATWFLGCCAALIALGMARDALPAPWATIALALVLVALVVGTPLVPELRWRRWRWEVREHEIDLQRGILVVRRTLIPMARVQHVDTTSDVIDQQFGLATVQIHTAAGSHKIPLLSTHDAAELRDRIAELANAP
jgi:membrane protein YdbS with pleckstrin-like domain